MYGTIYEARSLTTYKAYIGQTRRKLSKRKQEHINHALSGKHNTHFARAIRKYGPDDFVWRELAWNVPESQLDLWEEFYIHTENTYRVGYNDTKGGQKHIASISDESRKKISRHNKKKDLTKFIKAGKIYINQPKPIICLNDGKKYSSAYEASKVYNLNETAPSDVARGTMRHFKGYHFAYLKQGKPDLKPFKRYKAIRCKNDGKTYMTNAEAGRVYSLSSSCVCACINQSRPSRSGLSFEYVGLDVHFGRGIPLG